MSVLGLEFEQTGGDFGQRLVMASGGGHGVALGHSSEGSFAVALVVCFPLRVPVKGRPFSSDWILLFSYSAFFPSPVCSGTRSSPAVLTMRDFGRVQPFVGW